MDEEKQQKEGMLKKTGNAVKQGVKKQAKQAVQKWVKKIISMILPFLLKALAFALIAIIIITAISTLIDNILGNNAKDANAFAVKYESGSTTNGGASGGGTSGGGTSSGGSSGGNTSSGEEQTEASTSNSIIVDINNKTENGAYKLTYEFKDENGNFYTDDDQAIEKIKEVLSKKNENLDLSKFSASELKIIGALMYNGLMVEQYNEEELKAIVLFLKADIASQSFDLRSGDNSNSSIDIKTLRDSDEVYGTIELHKTTVETDEAGNVVDNKEIKLEYVPYGDETTAGTFCYMVAQNDRNALESFSIDQDGNLAIARWGESTTTYTYLDESGKNALSSEDKQKIAPENILENRTDFSISLYPLPINYKQYIAKYITNFGFLSDLLRTTDNVEFCEEIAKLAFNSKIVFNVKEELTTFESTETSKCTQTTLLYDYVKYETSGQKETKTEVLEQIKTGSGAPGKDTELANKYGWNPGLSNTQQIGNNLKYVWTHSDGIKYQLYHIITSSNQRWTLHKYVEKTTNANLPKEPGASYVYPYEEGDLIGEDYTRKEEFKYTVVEATNNKNNKYDLDLSKIDCWFLKYEKKYENPTLKTVKNESTNQRPGQYPEEFQVLVNNTSDATQINNDIDVQEFVNVKKEQYQAKYPEAQNVECNVTNLTVKQRVKTDADVTYTSKMNTYSFGEEVDTTEVKFKNVEYINGQPSYTSQDEDGNEEIGFLSIYSKYRDDGIDLYLEDDKEKAFFSLLESNSKTIGIADTMRYLLYVWDGYDRGVTNISIKIIDIEDLNKVKGSSTENFIKAWENSELWNYERGNTSVIPTKYLSEDEFGYVVYEDGSNGHNNIAYGIATFISSETNAQVKHPEYGNGYYNDCKTLFEAEGVLVENLHSGTFVDKAIVDSVFSKFLKENFIDEVDLYLDTNLPGYTFSKAQKNALVAIMWQRGNLGNFDSAYVNSLNTDGTINTQKIKENFVVNGEKVFNYTSTVNDRMYANWLLFTEETYIDTEGNVIPLGNDSIVEAAYEVAEHFMNSGADVHYAGNDVEEATNNGRHCKYNNIQASWDAPIENPQDYGVVCATFVSLAIWKADLIDTATINQYGYNSCFGLDNMLTTSEYSDEWEVILNWEELQEGDIVYVEGHVFIYMEGEKCLDQNYCVITSGGRDLRGNLLDASKYESKFIKGFRYVG